MDDAPDELRKKAAKCRRLAGEIADLETAGILLELAADYERLADEVAAGDCAAVAPRPEPS